MKRLLLSRRRAAGGGRGRPGADYPGQADHHRRAVHRRRADRQGGARPRRGAAQAARRRDDRDRERRRRRRHARRHQGGARRAPDGYTLLLHHIGMATSPALYRNLPYKTLDDFEYLGMINEVPMTLIGKPDAAGQQLRRAGQVDRRQQGQGQPRQRRPRRGLAPVRPAVPERAQDRHDDRAVQGHRAGDDRPDRRPGRPDVRPDHQHDAARSRPARSRPTR